MINTDAKSIGERLRLLRKQQQRQQLAFAQDLGIGLSTYARYERGERLPDIHLLATLVERGISCDWLLTGTEQKSEPAATSTTEVSLPTLRAALQAVFGAASIGLDEEAAERLADKATDIYGVLSS